jgi:hypothetical protein
MTGQIKENLDRGFSRYTKTSRGTTYLCDTASD